MYIRVVLQARTSSARLPAKVLLPVADVPLAVLCAQRIARSGLDLVLATSNDQSDDLLATEAIKHQLKVYRGSLGDVLQRLADAVVDLNDNDIVVRMTADNPVPDADFVASLVDIFADLDLDYLGTSSPVDGLPYGLSAEVMTARALRLAQQNASSPYDREHVTPWIRRHLNAQILDRSSLNETDDLSFLRCTVDTFADYLHINVLFSRPGVQPVRSSWRELVDELLKLSTVPGFIVPWIVNNGAVESIIALGTVQLGMNYGVANIDGMPEAEQARQLIRLAIEHGVNWIDTARGYGMSEQRVGEALSDGWSSRVRVVTKLDPLTEMDESMSSFCVENAVVASVYKSMKNLQMNSLDVLLLHRWAHRHANRGQIWQILLTMKGKGLIRELGASIYNPEEAIEALADENVSHLQIPFNILDRRWLNDDFQHALAGRPDVRIHVRSVFLQGLLINDADIWPSWDEQAGARVDSIKALQKTLSRHSRADLCMAYVLAHDWVDSVVIGVENRDQLINNLKLVCGKPLDRKQCELVERQITNVPLRLLNPSQW